jgi:diguanylate cyclase (GGDEF)-like protein
MYHDTALLDEPARLAALKRLAVLDSEPEEPFENVVALIRTVLDVPMAAVSLLDEDRQWFKARSGVDVTETPRGDSFCTHAIQQREPMIIPDATKDPRFAANPLVVGGPEIRSYAGIPLQTPDGYNVGSLCAIDTRTRNFSPAEIATLAKFARIVVDELELRRIAGRDQLTGALTRRGFLEKANEELERFRRYHRPASLTMVDIDHFKSINDTHGHPIGDKVLSEFAERLRRAARPNDVLGRLGGEEFAMLMPETSAEEALAAANRFREEIAAPVFTPAPGLELRVTASFGIAQSEDGIVHAEGWIAAADAPLYEAKHSGRNRCVVASTRAGAPV